MHTDPPLLPQHHHCSGCARTLCTWMAAQLLTKLQEYVNLEAELLFEKASSAPKCLGQMAQGGWVKNLIIHPSQSQCHPPVVSILKEMERYCEEEGILAFHVKWVCQWSGLCFTLLSTCSSGTQCPSWSMAEILQGSSEKSPGTSQTLQHFTDGKQRIPHMDPDGFTHAPSKSGSWVTHGKVWKMLSQRKSIN